MADEKSADEMIFIQERHSPKHAGSKITAALVSFMLEHKLVALGFIIFAMFSILISVYASVFAFTNIFVWGVAGLVAVIVGNEVQKMTDIFSDAMGYSSIVGPIAWFLFIAPGAKYMADANQGFAIISFIPMSITVTLTIYMQIVILSMIMFMVKQSRSMKRRSLPFAS